MRTLRPLLGFAVLIAVSCESEGIIDAKPLVITSVNPSSGPTAGGTLVSVRGSGFPSNISLVLFGDVPSGPTNVVGDTLATVVTPPHPAGPVDVTAVLTTGISATAPNAFAYLAPPPTTVPAPSLTAIIPTFGPQTGGTSFTIQGNAIQSGAGVLVGGVSATTVSVTGTTRISATTPAHAPGAVDVIVTNPDARADTLVAAFTFVPPPALTGISPASGSQNGGTVFTIQGSAIRSGATVTFGGTPATGVAVTGTTTISGTAPAHAIGAVDVVVTNSDGQADTLAAAFTYAAPPPPAGHTVVALSRTAGSAAGGATVVISGSNFAAGATVTFGSSAATVSGVTPTQLTVVTPANPVGLVSVSVTQAGATAALPSSFEYLPAPTSVYFNTGFEDGTSTPFSMDGASLDATLGASTEQAFAGTHSLKSARNTTTGSAAASLVLGGPLPPNPPVSETNGFYLRWYIYIPTATVNAVQGTQQQIKVHLFRRRAGNGQPGWIMCGVGAGFGGQRMKCFIDNGIGYVPGGDTNITFGDGVWHEFQLWYKRSGGNGRAKMWVNGKQIFDVTSPLMGYDSATDPYQIFLGIAHTEHPSTPIAIYLDNAAAANGYIDP